jgi:hypothetical protein
MKRKVQYFCKQVHTIHSIRPPLIIKKLSTHHFESRKGDCKDNESHYL